MKYPNSTTTSVYGPEYTSSKCTIVGSYQSGTPGITPTEKKNETNAHKKLR